MFINNIKEQGKIMKIQFSPQNFKGYDATPIKSLYLGTPTCDPDLDVIEDIKDVAKREGIKTYLLTSDNIFEDEIPDNWVGGYMDPWNQDKMLFLENNKKVEVHAADGLWGLPHKLSQKFLTRGIKESDVWLKTACGNYFVGKKENGEKYILAGEASEIDAKKIAEIQKIKPENIHIIPQSAFHIDMIVRPIGYPYILVNDEEKVEENIENLNATNSVKNNSKILAKKYRSDISRNGKQVSGKEIAKILESQGFKPILIGGLYSYGANFMNAIIHKRNDGNLVYITNSAENLGKGRAEEQLQKMFEKDLRKKVPNIAKVDFILGKEARFFGENNIFNYLISDGGVHCMCAEEPDFDKWV